jgi:filamentous hemagglutinin family protein
MHKNLSGVACPLLSSLTVSGILIFSHNQVLAQVTPDNTLGNESSVVNTRDATSDSIDGGAIRGQNLFHSFQEFNVGAGRGVYFANPEAVTNIFSRVTGNNVSNILGTLGVDGTANLFLINPNGIVFGEGASLDVNGSFAATTADGIEFGEQGFFSASNPESPNLLTINPSAYLFNQISPGAIANNSQASADFNLSASFDDNFFGLRVPDGQSLLLLGGNVNADGGGLIASGGRIDIGAIAGEGIVELNNNGSLNIPNGIPRGDISLTNGAGFLVAGDGGGDIAIAAKNISIDSASSIKTGIFTNLGSPNAQAGDLNLNATGTISVKDGNSFISNDVFTGATGKAGDLTIDTNNLIISDGGQIGAGTFGEGDGGNVTVSASNIELEGISSDGQFFSGLFTTVESQARGNGGNLTINTDNLSLRDRAEISASTFSVGNAGNIVINATDSVSLDKGNTINSNIEQGAVGNGGQIEINTNTLNLTNGGQVLTIVREARNNLPAGKGNAGNIAINVDDTLTLNGRSEDGQFTSSIYSYLSTGAAGNAGNLKINAGNLIAQDGGEISSSTFGQGDSGDISITTDNSISLDASSYILNNVQDINAVGNAGKIDITTGSLSVKNGSQINSFTRGQGNAGDITVQATDAVTFDGFDSNNNYSSSSSSVEAGGVGNGGDINITARSLSLTNGAELNTSVREALDPLPGGNGNGGDLTINADNLSLRDSAEISASTFSVGNAGNIVINATDSVSLDGGSILSTVEAGAVGDGGQVKIDTGNFSVINDGQIETSVRLGYSVLSPGIGNAGDIIINAREDINIDGGFLAIASALEPGAIGKAGDIKITSNSLILTNGVQVLTSTLGQGDGGDIIINARETINLDGTATFEENLIPSLISSGVGNEGKGKAGNINIQAENLFLKDGGAIKSNTLGKNDSDNAGNIDIILTDILEANNGEISTSSTQSSGGAINIRADNINLRGNSDIRSNIFSGTGGSGNIDITADSIIAFDDSDIFAFAADGQGGNITLDTPAYFAENFTRNSLTSNPDFLDNNSRADLNATGAVSGVVSIPDVSFIQNSLNNLPDNSINTDELVANSCVSPVGKRQEGKFIITGTGGLPDRPGNGSISDFATGEVRSVPSNNSGWHRGEPIVEPQGVYRLTNGKLVMSRECHSQ